MEPISLDDFFNYLPKLNDEEYYLLYLISRDKEAKEELGTSVDKVLFRIIEVNPKRATEIMKAIRERSEVFTVKGYPVKKEWVKIMFVLNPVNFVKTSRKTASRYVDMCGEKADVMKIYHSEMPKNIDFRIFMIDIDSKEKGLLTQLSGIKSRLVITTKRGFHIHVWKDDVEDPRSLFKLQGVEVKTRDSIEYVPFIDQGGFVPQAFRIQDASEVIELTQNDPGNK
ncbi:hypothetical protein [Sulfuracidifex tepidarius]|uniref:DNA primase small subunit PriS n=1 Tax=Sulfuracidifex tepidarius TaxID=1294262 RepID=A0A510DYG1_9CREN|nr:hypothetical protein [Sulfuracidifex tepidarius]BBG25227.1 hypothetical protein IC006_2562 [Sulfuracidifex tepidarius]BBG28021.1 hypothetical protein IC007_2576 [Sulfuracidifex tepidarius]